jgi:hypothetical protein
MASTSTLGVTRGYNDGASAGASVTGVSPMLLRRRRRFLPATDATCQANISVREKGHASHVSYHARPKAGTVHSIPSRRQLVHGGPSLATLQRTLRARQTSQATDALAFLGRRALRATLWEAAWKPSMSSRGYNELMTRSRSDFQCTSPPSRHWRKSFAPRMLTMIQILDYCDFFPNLDRDRL